MTQDRVHWRALILAVLDLQILIPVTEGCTNTGLQVAWATEFCTLTPNTFSVMIAFFPVLKKCVSVHMHRAESAI